MARRLGLALIRGYQLIVSPFLGRNCRYSPTCSAYAYESVERYGLITGVRMGVTRLGRCHPLHEGGYDPVPERETAA